MRGLQQTEPLHPDFNKDGPWSGSAVERTIRVWDKQAEVRLPWTQRADGSSWDGSAEAPTPKKNDKDKSRDKDYYGNSRGNNDGDRRGSDGGATGRTSVAPIVEMDSTATAQFHVKWVTNPLDMKLRWI